MHDKAADKTFQIDKLSVAKSNTGGESGKQPKNPACFNVVASQRHNARNEAY